MLSSLHIARANQCHNTLIFCTLTQTVGGGKFQNITINRAYRAYFINHTPAMFVYRAA